MGEKTANVTVHCENLLPLNDLLGAFPGGTSEARIVMETVSIAFLERSRESSFLNQLSPGRSRQAPARHNRAS